MSRHFQILISLVCERSGRGRDDRREEGVRRCGLERRVQYVPVAHALRNAIWPIVVTPDLLNRIRSFTYRQCGNQHDAEDRFQAACVTVITKLLTWHCEGADFNFEAWFYRCAEREAINSYRRSRARTAWVFDKATRVRDAEGMDPHNPRPAKREPEEEVTDHRERGPVEELETQELIWRVRAALTNPALTPEQERLASLLLSEATTSEIADALDIEGTSPLSNVNNKVQRLYRKLRQLIEIE